MCSCECACAQGGWAQIKLGGRAWFCDDFLCQTRVAFFLWVVGMQVRKSLLPFLPSAWMHGAVVVRLFTCLLLASLRVFVGVEVQGLYNGVGVRSMGERAGESAALGRGTWSMICFFRSCPMG